jgi:serralysin
MTITYTPGVETRVNTYVTDEQSHPSVAALSGGGYVVTWSSDLQDGSNYGIYMQRYNASGVAQGTETQVNTYTSSYQWYPSVAALSGGGYVVTWGSVGQDGDADGIYMQRYNASGVAQGSETLVNTYTTSNQSSPSVAAFSSGGYVVTWTSLAQDGSALGIYMQRFDNSGGALGSETLVNTYTTNIQSDPSVTTLSDGSYVVTWMSVGQDGSGEGVYMQRYNASGVAQGSETRVNTTTNFSQLEPSVAPISGGYVVTWSSLNQAGTNYDIYMQRYNLSGVAQGSETRVNATTGNNQTGPSVAALADGGYVVTWQSNDQDGSNFGIYMQRYDASGGAQGSETLVNTYTTYDQAQPSVTVLPDGSYVVTWSSNGQDGSSYGVYSKLYTAVDSVITVAATTDYTGQTLTNKDGITFTAAATATFTADQFGAGLIDNAVAITGNANTNAIVINKTTAPAFTAAGWTFTNWTAGTDTITINGTAVADTITGSSQNDSINGGTGADSMSGGAGDDTYVVDDVGDTITEASGTDTVQTTLASYTLGTGLEHLTGLSGTGQTLTGNTVANAITGSTGADTLSSGAGNDTLDGGTGADSMDGGADNDTYVVDDAGDTITDASGTDTVRTTLASYTLASNLENLTGLSGTGQMLTGNAGANTITGGSGNDTVDGGTGADSMSGGAGDDTYVIDDAGDVINDTSGSNAVQTALASYSLTTGVNVLIGSASTGQNLYGNADNNTITGGSGNDILEGGFGVDRMVGGAGNDTYGVTEAGDVIVELAGGGNSDFVYVYSNAAPYTYLLPDNVENAAVYGTGTGIIGNASANNLFGSNGNDTLSGLAGNDFMDAGIGIDVLDGGDDNDTILGGEHTDTVRGGAGNDELYPDGYGSDGAADLVEGGAGDDTIWGGTGGDTLLGGADNDLYHLRYAGTVITELANEGTDTIIVSLTSYTLDANIENGTLYFNTTGGTLNGNGENNKLEGSYGNDTLNGGLGNDTLDGRLGIDSLTGGDGDDVYTTDVAGDVIVELANEGTDTVNTTSTSYTLSDNLENLSQFGLDNSTLTGNALNNIITGGTEHDSIAGLGGADTLIGGLGRDTLDGGTGDDSMTGGAGDDTYVVDSFNDVVVELAGGGTDTLQTMLTNVVINDIQMENLTGLSSTASFLMGNVGANVITGNTGNDTLVGLLGNDTMFGGGGEDYLYGGTGSDYLYGGAGLDVMIGEDGGDVMNGGDGDGYFYSGTGGNIMTGGIDNDVFISEGFYDAMAGGDGHNQYYRYATGQTSVTGGAGIDEFSGGTLVSWDAFSGGAGNDIALGGGGSDTLYGGDDDDFLVGEDDNDSLYGDNGSDQIYGGVGNNRMFGGAGNDVFISEGQYDTIDGGADQNWYYRYASGSAFVVGGSGVDQYVGGAFASRDTFDGNGGDDFAFGGDGDDELNGGAGSDALYGQNGNDTIDGGAGVNLIWADGTGTDQIRVDVADMGTQVIDYFEAGGGYDYVRLIGSTLTSFADFEALLTNYGTEVNGNMVINGATSGILYLNVGANQSAIWFQGISVFDLTAADFVFG